MDTNSINLNEWNEPIFVGAREVGESVELIYKQYPSINFTSHPIINSEPRVFKIVYCCKNGKWNKSEPKYGVIIPATDEDYDFD